MSRVDVMVDLETLGTDGLPALLSLGAVFFDPDGDDVPRPEMTANGGVVRNGLFYRVDAESCAKRVGASFGMGAIRFWMEQPKEAQDAAFGAHGYGRALDVATVADELAGTCKELHEALEEDEEDDLALMQALDLCVFRCEVCGWWCRPEEAAEDKDDFCDECVTGENE